jgi:riboflavin kinase/FMN adenylyltransferase
LTLICDPNQLPSSARHGAITIGNFDGVHRGHASIIERLRLMAQRVEGPSVVFTFDPHPVALLRPDSTPPPLCWVERKAALLESLGVDFVFAYPTHRDLLELPAESFFRQTLLELFAARAVVEGPNFRFGKDRLGDVETLQTLCDANGMLLEIAQPLPLEDGRLASSSEIRKWIAAGRIELANKWLITPHRVRGRVVHGAARGAAIGFPTANLADVDMLTPAQGVYAGKVRIDGREHLAAINVGPKPTFGDTQPSLETHLLDFHGDLYGTILEVDFTKRLREIQSFADVSELKRQLADDITLVRQWAAEDSHQAKER